MKPAPIIRVPVFSLIVGILFLASSALPAEVAPDRTYTAAWHRIDSLGYQRLTASALAAIDTVYQSAERDGVQEQIVKALLYRARFESDKEEDAEIKTIVLFEKETARATGPLASLLHSITAELYWKYFQQNRWRISQRTQTDDSIPADIALWDLSKIVAAVLRHYDASLQGADSLTAAPLPRYRGLLSDSTCLDNRRPTLFDFLAHRAIDFFMNSESDLTKPSYVFQLDSAGYFGDAAAFARAPLATRDSLSFKFRALKALRQLIAFHLSDGNIDALVDADLKRLEFVRACSTIEARDTLYLSALEGLLHRVEKNQAASEVLFKLAAWYAQRGDAYKAGSDTSGRWMKKKALEICDSALTRYGESFGGRECEAFRGQLLEKNLSLHIEGFEVPGKPFCALLQWTNIDRMAYCIVPLPDSCFNDRWGEYPRDLISSFLATHKPIARWMVALPDPGDLQAHSAEIAMQALDIGRYAIVASTDSTFSDKRSILVAIATQVTSIAYFARTRNDRSFELFVRDRETGKAIKGAVVKRIIEKRSGPEGTNITYDTTGIETIDGTGRALFPADSLNNEFTVSIDAGKDHLLHAEWQQAGYHYSGPLGMKTVFFTDRSIYRPGQTIYFKGIVLQGGGDTSAVVPHRKTRVTFCISNPTSLDLVTNDYGTFSGSFIAPREGLLGTFYIRSDIYGEAVVSVEEYKRPKFEVTMSPVKEQFRLNAAVTLTGQAKSYAGSPIDRAVVKYRVTRAARPSWWWDRGGPYPSSKVTEIAHDSIRTDDTGGFRIVFTANPDPTVAQSGNPAFDYTVNVDVTNAGGETRSAVSRVTIGYAALDLFVALPQYVDKLRDTSFPIRTLNMSGMPVAAKGTIRIYRLKGPDQPVRGRYWPRPDTAIMSEADFREGLPGLPFGGEDTFVNWPKEKLVLETPFDTKTDSMLLLRKAADWSQGVYVVEASSVDTFGQKVNSRHYFLLYSQKERAAAARFGDIFIPVKPSGEPGEKAAFIVGSGYKDVQALFEVLHKGEIIKKEWLTFSNSQELVEVPIQEKFRGNFEVHFTFIKNGRGYSRAFTVTVPWSNKELRLSFETFRDKLRPGQNEEWRIKIRGPKGEAVAAEMVAAMYDASLDAFKPHAWAFETNGSDSLLSWWNKFVFFGGGRLLLDMDWNWDRVPFPHRCDPTLNWFGYTGYGYGQGVLGLISGRAGFGSGAFSSLSLKKGGGIDDLMGAKSAGRVEAVNEPVADSIAAISRSPLPGRDDLSSVHPRANLNETAFFYPHLTTNDSGEVTIAFTVPEALTRWKVLGLAHTKDLKFCQFEKLLVTQKPLMVMPTLPRFLRENDRIALSAEIVNLADSGVAGSASLMLFDAITMKPLDSAFGNSLTPRTFTIPKGLSSAIAWEVRVPEGIGPVVARIAAKAGDASDGEDNMLPVVVNRTLVTETMPLPIHGTQTKKFTFAKLLSQGNGSPTLRNYRLTLEFSQNPAWYAIGALPSLMETSDNCTEKLFSRFYATTIAAAIANASPKIKAVFEAWKSQGADALLSNLERNQELKSALLEETPWVLDGKNETERKHRVGVLFDLNIMSAENSASLNKLQQMQERESGAWPWFPGMAPDRFVTQYIITGLGRLRHLSMLPFDPPGKSSHGVWRRNSSDMIEQGIRYLDGRIRSDYEEALKEAREKSWPLDSDHLGCEQIQYLYARSYFTDVKLTDSNRVAFDYYKQQAAKYWMRQNRYLQGMIALALHRLGEKKVPDLIIKSLTENALHSDEMGMYWKEMYEGYYWYAAPIEAQALAIEAFDEVAHDTAAVEELKAWLLKSKQTSDWRTSKATADACYALLLRGSDLLSTHHNVSVTLGPVRVDPEKLPHAAVEAGTGYFKTSWNAAEIKPEMGTITVSRDGSGVAWGAVYWQYFEDLDKITPAASPLTLKRHLFVKRMGDRGPLLDPLADGKKIRVGDKVTVRIELTVDRDLEYVHMKDQRAAGFEPVGVLSGYRWQDGLGYYESTRDLATHFFFSGIGKGRYVFEYEMIATLQGDFSNGIATIQCMYAPEFAAHSEGVRVTVEKN